MHTKSIVLGRLCARHAVAIADLAYKNSVKEGVRVSERSRAKSSAAKMRPERYGVALHMLERSDSALADSIRARIFIGGSLGGDDGGLDGCLKGRVCRITSVTKCRSDAEFTFGTTRVSRFGALSYKKSMLSHLAGPQVLMNCVPLLSGHPAQDRFQLS